MKRTRIITLAAIATWSAGVQAQTGQAACEQLRSLHIGASRILTADYRPAGEFHAPALGAFIPPPVMLPPHCSVRVFTPTSSDSGVTAEIWLPDAAGLYHGWADAVVPPEDTIGYYERVKQSLGTEAGASVRLFMVPGMGHCAGGPGATTFDALGTLDQWVIGNVIPESIPAEHESGGRPLFERPLCAYPKSAQWDGRSDPAKASSFRCIGDLNQ